MLKTYHITVKCLLDGRIKDFYFTATPDYKLGLNRGCNDKTVCRQCRECWLDVRQSIRDGSLLQSKQL